MSYSVKLLQWSDKLVTGVKSIDAQHKELIDRANNIYKLDGLNATVERAFETLDFLADYVLMHFKHEEDCMIEMSYPDYYKHKFEHDSFMEEYTVTRQKCIDSNSTEKIIELTSELVSDWLTNHIGLSDMELAAYLKTLQ